MRHSLEHTDTTDNTEAAPTSEALYLDFSGLWRWFGVASFPLSDSVLSQASARMPGEFPASPKSASKASFPVSEGNTSTALAAQATSTNPVKTTRMEKLDNSETPSNVIDDALAVSAFVLNALQAAAQGAPVPFLQAAASITLNILKNAQAMRSNKEAFQDLAKDACDFVYVVMNIHKAQEDGGLIMPGSLNSNLQTLVATLTEIDKFAQKQVQRNGFKRFVMSSSDTGKIQGYRDRMTKALNIFWLQSSIHVRQQLAHIAEQQDVLHKDLLNPGRATSTVAVTIPSGRDILTALSEVKFSGDVQSSTAESGISGAFSS